jgi:hypothetical protein
MALTKMQTAAICAIIAAAPLAWQWRAEAKIADSQNVAVTELATAQRRANELELQSRQALEALHRAQADTLNAQARLSALNARRNGAATSPAYHWDDNSPYVRVPKKFLDDLSHGLDAAANQRGKLDPRLIEVLQLTGDEADLVQKSIDKFMDGYHKAQTAGMHPHVPAKNELYGRKLDEVRMFDMPDVSASVRELRLPLLTELSAAVGAERFALLGNALRNWMPLDDEYYGMNTSVGVLPFQHCVGFEKPAPGDIMINWSVSKPNGEMMSAAWSFDEIPDFYREKIQDWIDLAQSQPPKGLNLDNVPADLRDKIKGLIDAGPSQSPKSLK